LRNERGVATGLGRTAQILEEQGRYDEADARYKKAFAAAQRAGDQGIQGTILLSQGTLAYKREQYERAVDLCKRALKLFQEANDEEGVMRTCNLLGVVERDLGRLPEARAWYERSREIAQSRGDIEALGGAAQNLGIVCQDEGEAARQRGDEVTARHHFQEAEELLQESLRLSVERDDKPGEAGARGQLAKLCLLTGELDKAEEHVHRAREIVESLGLFRDLPKCYSDLAKIPRARGDEAQAAGWEAKLDAVWKELDRRAGGGQGASGLPGQFVQAIMALAAACAQAGVSGAEVSEEAEEALGPLAGMGPAMGAVATFLRGLAAGAFPAGVPGGLPEELKGPLQQLLDAAREDRGGA
jgi:tetratricopeptide (TPR) repeat protein